MIQREKERKSRLNSQIKRRVSQRCIHSSKVTDPHPRLLLRAKCSMEKSDEQRERGKKKHRVKKTPFHPLTATPSWNHYLKRIAQHALSSSHFSDKRHKQLISQQNWGFSNTVSYCHTKLKNTRIWFQKKKNCPQHSLHVKTSKERSLIRHLTVK